MLNFLWKEYWVCINRMNIFLFINSTHPFVKFGFKYTTRVTGRLYFSWFFMNLRISWEFGIFSWNTLIWPKCYQLGFKKMKKSLEITHLVRVSQWSSISENDNHQYLVKIGPNVKLWNEIDVNPFNDLNYLTSSISGCKQFLQISRISFLLKWSRQDIPWGGSWN